MANVKKIRMVLPLVLVVATFLYLFIRAPGFLAPANVQNVFSFASLLAIPAMGLAIVMLTGMFDLSFVGVIGLAAVVTSSLLELGLPIWVCLGITLALCVGCGLLNSFLIINMRIHPWLATIATMLVFLGLEKAISKGAYVGADAPFLEMIRFDSFLGISMALWVIFLVVLAVLLLIHTMDFGLHLYAVGGNLEAAKKSGINVVRLQYAAFVFMGVLCWVASILYIGKLSGYPTESAYINQLPVILAVYFGLAISRKNVFNVLGAFVGALYVGFLSNGMGLTGLESYWIKMVEGCLVIVVVLGNSIIRGDIVTYE